MNWNQNKRQKGLTLSRKGVSIIFSLLLSLTLFSGCNSRQPHKGFYGPWVVSKMGPEHELRAPKGAKITYQFKTNGNLQIKTPYKNGNVTFKKLADTLKFADPGLFGGFKSFTYHIKNDTLTLKTPRGFVVTFHRPQK